MVQSLFALPPVLGKNMEEDGACGEDYSLILGMEKYTNLEKYFSFPFSSIGLLTQEIVLPTFRGSLSLSVNILCNDPHRFIRGVLH